MVQLMHTLLDISLARYYAEDSIAVSPQDNAIGQLHSFFHASNCSYGAVVYLRRLLNGIATVSIVFDRSKVVSRRQNSRFIARKELVAAVTTIELSKQALDA